MPGEKEGPEPTQTAYRILRGATPGAWTPASPSQGHSGEEPAERAAERLRWPAARVGRPDRSAYRGAEPAGAQELPRPVECSNQGSDVVNSSVDEEARAGGAGHPETPHERLGTVMPRSHGDALGVERRGEV